MDLFNIFKNLSCSNYCTDNEFEQDSINNNNTKSWNLYLKEYEMYSAMILYNSKLNKDISYLINKNDVVTLLDEKNIFIKLEYISDNEEDKRAILVPTDDFVELYEKIEKMDKTFDKELNAYLIGTYDIKKK